MVEFIPPKAQIDLAAYAVPNDGNVKSAGQSEMAGRCCRTAEGQSRCTGCCNRKRRACRWRSVEVADGEFRSFVVKTNRWTIWPQLFALRDQSTATGSKQVLAQSRWNNHHGSTESGVIHSLICSQYPARGRVLAIGFAEVCPLEFCVRSHGTCIRLCRSRLPQPIDIRPA